MIDGSGAPPAVTGSRAGASSVTGLRAGAFVVTPVGAVFRSVGRSGRLRAFELRRHITVPMAPQAMARRMSTIAGMRSGEQLTSEDAVEATAGEKAEDAAEATPDEKVEDAAEATEAAEVTADEKAEATAVAGLGTAGAQWPEAGTQARISHWKAPATFV